MKSNTERGIFSKEVSERHKEYTQKLSLIAAVETFMLYRDKSMLPSERELILKVNKMIQPVPNSRHNCVSSEWKIEEIIELVCKNQNAQFKQ